MALSAIGIAGTVIAAGVGGQQSHATAVHAGEARRDEAYAQSKLQADAANKQKKTELEQAQAAARARDQAQAASTSNFNPNVATNMTGNVGNASGKSSSLLGY